MSAVNEVDTQDSLLPKSDIDQAELDAANTNKAEHTVPDETPYFWSEPGVCG